MTLFVDTSVWSLAFRRDEVPLLPEVLELKHALERGDTIVTTGLVLQELLQGFSGPRARNSIVECFSALPLISPTRDDHIDAATLRNRARKSGVQIGTIDALLAQLCLRNVLTLLTADKDFAYLARHCSLRIWTPTS